MRKEKKQSEIIKDKEDVVKKRLEEIKEKIEYKEDEISDLEDEISSLEHDVRCLESERGDLIKKQKNGFVDGIHKKRAVYKDQAKLEVFNAV